MRHVIQSLTVAAALATAAAHAQEVVDSNLIEPGLALYTVNCAICHTKEGLGRPPTIPALKGNQNLADLYLIVHNMQNGQVIMPPFPALSSEDMAKIATYVRNSWGNSFGGATVIEVDTIKAELDLTGPVKSIWDGVYTQAQADRGKAVFTSPCGICHGTKLNGSPDDMDMRGAPPLARASFLRVWTGRSLGTLLSYTRVTMPQSNPGMLPEEDYVAIIAHMLATSGAPPGDTPLPSDVASLGHILIGPKP